MTVGPVVDSDSGMFDMPISNTSFMFFQAIFNRSFRLTGISVVAIAGYLVAGSSSKTTIKDNGFNVI